MLARSPETGSFWQGFRRYAGADHDDYIVGSFGDSPKMATELADLVVAGIKRATASAARDDGQGREPMPKPGDLVMMLDVPKDHLACRQSRQDARTMFVQ